MELLPNVMTPVTLTVPPPMVRVATEVPLVEAAELELVPMFRVVNAADPVPPEAIRLSVPVILPKTCVVPVRAPSQTVVATSVPVSKVNVPDLAVVVAAEFPPMPSVVMSRSLLCPARLTKPDKTAPVLVLP